MVMVLQMADDSFATDYKCYEINSVNKVYRFAHKYSIIALNTPATKRLPRFVHKMDLGVH